MNQKETKQQGVPVFSTCKRCGGRGYERIPSTEAHAAVCQITDVISLDTWKKSVKPFYDQLITKFDIEEAMGRKPTETNNTITVMEVNSSYLLFPNLC